MQNADLDPRFRGDDGEGAGVAKRKGRDDKEKEQEQQKGVKVMRGGGGATPSPAVIPSEDGIQACPSVGWDPGLEFRIQNTEYKMRTWIPAFAGMTKRGVSFR